MKVIETKTFRVSLVVPESETEKAAIERVIEEIKSEKVPRSEWNVIDNRHKNRPGTGA